MHEDRKGEMQEMAKLQVAQNERLERMIAELMDMHAGSTTGYAGSGQGQGGGNSTDYWR